MNNVFPFPGLKSSGLCAGRRPRRARRPACWSSPATPARHERGRTRPAAGAERRTRRIRASRQAAPGDLRAVLAVRAVDRHGGAVRGQRPALVRQGQRTGTRGHPELLPHQVRRGHPRPQARRPAHADGPAAAHQRLGRRPEREGPLVGILDDGPARREGRVGGRHLRERVRARARRVEDLPHALQPDVRGPVCDRLAQRRRGPEDRPVPLHAGRDRHPGPRPARVGDAARGSEDESGRRCSPPSSSASPS